MGREDRLFFKEDWGRRRVSNCTAQKMKFSIQHFFNKCDQISRKLQIWSHLLKKPSMEKFIFLCSDGSYKGRKQSLLLRNLK